MIVPTQLRPKRKNLRLWGTDLSTETNKALQENGAHMEITDGIAVLRII